MYAKRLGICAVTLALSMTLQLSACAQKQQDVKQPASAKASESSAVSPEAESLTLPIVSKPITLTYFTAIDSKVSATMKSYNEVEAYKEIEKRTGIHMEFRHPPLGQENENFSLMLASGSLADIMAHPVRNVTGGPEKLVKDGAIVALADSINKYAPNYKKILKDNPDLKREISLEDGTLYSFSKLKIDPYLKASGPIVRKDWLDKLGLPVPRTLDDWYKMLKAFKEKDPNGNGKADELPLISLKGGGSDNIQNFTGAFSVSTSFYKVNNVVKYGPVENGYREYVSTMAKWYKEGLIDPEFVSTDSKSFDAKVTNNLGGSYAGGRSSNTFGRFLDLMKKANSTFDLIGVPWPVSSDGKAYNVRSGMADLSSGEAVIAASNKYLNETVKWFDYCYGNEGHMLLNFGILNESYKMENGYPKYTDIITKNPEGLPLANALSKYCPATYNGIMNQDKRYFEQTLNYPQQKAGVETWAKSDLSLQLPPLLPSYDDRKKYVAIMSNAESYVSEMTTKFIIGLEPMEKYDQYLDTLKKMQIDEAVKIMQNALDRYNKKN